MVAAETAAQVLGWKSRHLVLRTLKKGHDLKMRECGMVVLAALRGPSQAGAGSAERSPRL